MPTTEAVWYAITPAARPSSAPSDQLGELRPRFCPCLEREAVDKRFELLNGSLELNCKLLSATAGDRGHDSSPFLLLGCRVQSATRQLPAACDERHCVVTMMSRVGRCAVRVQQLPEVVHGGV